MLSLAAIIGFFFRDGRQQGVSMRNSLSIALVLAASLAGGAAAQGGAPDLTGLWSVAESSTAFYDGRVTTYPTDFRRYDLVVKEQHGRVFFAEFVYEGNSGHPGRHSGEPVTILTWSVVGAIAYDGRRVIFADIGDTSVLDCVLVQSDVLECIDVEAGKDALAAVRRFERR